MSKQSQSENPQVTVPAIGLPVNVVPSRAQRVKNRIKTLVSASDPYLPLENLFITFGFIFITFAIAIANPSLLIICLAILITGYLQFQLFEYGKKALIKDQDQMILTDSESGQSVIQADPILYRIVKWGVFYPLMINPEDLESVFQLHRDRPEHLRRHSNERLAISVLGLTGLQRLAAVLASNLGIGYIGRNGSLKLIDRQTLNRQFIFENLKANLAKMILVHLVMLGLFVALSASIAYIYWFAGYLTIFSLMIELRAERSVEWIAHCQSTTDVVAKEAPIENKPLSEVEVAEEALADSENLHEKNESSADEASNPDDVSEVDPSSPVKARMMGVQSRLAKLRKSINEKSQQLTQNLNQKIAEKTSSKSGSGDLANKVEQQNLKAELDKAYSATELPVLERLKAQSNEIENENDIYRLLLNEEESGDSLNDFAAGPAKPNPHRSAPRT